MKKLKYRKGEREKVFQKFDGKCAYCGSRIEIDNFCVDHINPIKRFATNSLQEELLWAEQKRALHTLINMNPSCKGCNSLKNHLTVEQFRKKLELKMNFTENHYRILHDLNNIEINTPVVKFYFERQ